VGAFVLAAGPKLARAGKAFTRQALRVSGPDDACPELDCLRGYLPERLLSAAAARSERVGIGADQVLIASGAIDEEGYLRALAEHLGVQFEALDGLPRALCPLSDREIIEKGAAGMLSVIAGEKTITVVAPRRLAARQLSRMLRENPAQFGPVRLTTTERMNRFLLRSAGKLLAQQAADELRRTSPQMCAARHRRAGRGWTVALSAAAAALAFAPGTVVATIELLLGGMFLGWLALRFAGAALPEAKAEPLPHTPDAALPVYTVVAALYREATSVDELLRALARLDYPREKLQIILAVEADDRDTRVAIEKRTARVPVTVIPIPTGKPQTKPRALNAALPFVQGAFTVVYDAEDRPDPDQLRRALRAFAAGAERLACVQARLTIDNTEDGWLAALFTAEYAGHFDVFLDGLSALLLPLPLGGSSNHFRTSVLRKVGGWDAYNVTEDADLGLRLARFGFRTRMIASTTHEEAPARFKPWLKQRTRWMKGWMQTWAVHMRSPRRLMRELGPRGFFGMQLIILGNVVAALVHPLFLLTLIASIATGSIPWQSEHGFVLIALYVLNLFAGYIGSGVLGYIGLSRRGLRRTSWVLLLIPVHWLLLSLAAWRAAYQFIHAPQLWEKTEHGLARHSRRRDQTVAALRKLERLATRLQAEGKLPP